MNEGLLHGSQLHYPLSHLSSFKILGNLLYLMCCKYRLNEESGSRKDLRAIGRLSQEFLLLVNMSSLHLHIDVYCNLIVTITMESITETSIEITVAPNTGVKATTDTTQETREESIIKNTVGNNRRSQRRNLCKKIL